MSDSHEEIQERRSSAFDEWAEEHPHLANAIAGFTGGALTSIAIAAAGEPPSVIVLAIVATTATVFLFCELFTRLFGRPVLGGMAGARGHYYTGDDPVTALRSEQFFGGSDGGGDGGGGGGGGGDGGGG